MTTDVVGLLRTAWKATHHVPLASSADTEQIQGPSPDDETIARVLGDWMVGMEDSNKEHNSVLLFLDNKLRRIEAQVQEDRHPNRVRVAVAVALLDQMIARLRPHAASLVPLRWELLSAIYTKPSLQHAGLDWVGYNFHRKRLSSQQTIERLLGAHTYADTLEATNAALDNERIGRKVDARNAYRQGYAQAKYDWMRNARLKYVKMRIFRAWAEAVRLKKWERHLFEEFQRKLQLMAIMKPKPSKYNKHAVFNAWRLFVSLMKQRKLASKLENASSESKGNAELLHQAQKQLSETQATLREYMDKCKHLESSYKDLQTEAHHRLFRLRKVRRCGGCCY